jgi:hypothetical protein
MELAPLGEVAQEREEEWVEEAAAEQVAEQEEWAALERELALVENACARNVELRFLIKPGFLVPKQLVPIAEQRWLENKKLMRRFEDAHL